MLAKSHGGLPLCAGCAMYHDAPCEAVRIDYTNWRGERGTRRVIPGRIFFGANEWHPEPQWLMEAHDLEKDVVRTFSLKDIHSWTRIDEQAEA